MSKDKITDYDTTAVNNSDVGGVNIAEGCDFGNMNNMGREIMSHLADLSEGNFPIKDTFSIADPADLTKIARFDCGSITTSTTRVITLPDADTTLFGTTDTATLTNKTLTQPTITLKQSAGAAPTASGDVQWDTTDKKLVVGDGTNTLAHLQTGKWAAQIPASAMTPATTSGPAAGQVEESNGHNYATLDFDATTDEYACFEIFAPPSWNEGTVTFRVVWSTTATDTDGVAFALQAVGVADGDDSDVAYGTAVVVTDDAQSNAGDVLVTAESSAVTIAGSPVAGELLQFRFFRDVSDANDDMTEDARVRQVIVYFTLDDVNDA